MQIAQKIKENFRGQTLTEKACYVLMLTLVLQAMSPYVFVNTAHAAPLTEASIRLTRMSAGAVANSSSPILVIVKPATTIATGATPNVRVTWPTSSAFTVSSTDADHTADTTCVPSTYQGESVNTLTVTSPGAETSGAVTYEVGEDLTSGTLYGFCVTGGITNPSTPGQYVVDITTLADTTVTDTTDVAVDITATNSDQVTLYATVSAQFNFALSANTVNMQALSTSGRATGSITADVDTNANNGWVAWMRSQGGAATLASASTGDSISSSNTDACVTAAIGSKGYVVDVNASGGTGTGTLAVAEEYDCTDDEAGGVISTGYEQIAQRTGPVDSDTLTLEAIVTISNSTEAAEDYTDTWEVVGAGNF